MRLIAPFTFIAFFLSGISALVYELTWVRLLKHVFGSDSLALSTMLTVFIGGIALGTFIAGKLIEHYFRFDRDLDEQSQHALNLGQGYSLMFSYCLIELALGLYALLIPILLGPLVLGNIWSIFAGYALENAIIGSLLKFVISTLLLIIPTMLMGISFPILTELLAIHNGKNFTNHHTDQFAAANLYATNTFGAIIGAIVGGFYLLPQLGLNTSVYLAALVNIFIAIFCSLWFLINRDNFSGANPIQVFDFISNAADKLNSVVIKTKLAHIKLSENEKKYHQTISILLIISFTIGFINLSLEVIWTKILTLVIGSSTYSLSIILIAVLLGISSGAYLLNWVIKLADYFRISYIKFLKTSLFSFAVLIFISSCFFNQLPWLFLQLSQALTTGLESSDWLVANVLKFCIVAIIAIPVTFVEGVIFAFILYLISSDTNLIDTKLLEPVGTRVARASYTNTVGAIIGSFITGFLFIPLLGKFGSGIYYSLEIFIIMAFLLALLPYRLNEEEAQPITKPSKLYGSREEKIKTGLKAWFAPKESENTFKFAWGMISIVITMCIAMLLLPQLNTQEISSGVSIYNGLKYKSINKRQYQNAIAEKILFHKEGLNSIVTVVENESANAIFLKNNGKIEAGKPIRPEDPSKADMLTQILLGQIPIMVKPESRTALLIGMGSGVSLKSLAKAGSKAKLARIDICEIEEQVFRAAEKFFNAPTGPTYKGIELKRHVTDARNFLSALNSSSEPIANYDLIISQPSDPWISSALFTQEFWQLAANNLNEQGVFAQWLQLYSIDPEYLKIALTTFQSVFPEVLIFRPGNAAELIIIGSKSEIDLDSNEIKSLIAQKDLRKELTQIGINNEAELLTNLVLVPESVKTLVNANGSNNNKPVKVLKYISKIDIDSTQYQPKLTSFTPNTESSVLTESAVPNSLNTDDNMRLEFHTSQKINEFYETLKENENFLVNQVDPKALIRFLAEQKDPNLLMKIARAHSQINNKFHQKMALGLAQELYNINQTPASALTLYEIYKNRMEDQKAESILYEAQSKFSDIISTDRKARVTIFEGLLEGPALDDFQLASLAEIYTHSLEWSKAEALIEKALELNPFNADLFIEQADIKFKHIQTQFNQNKLSTKAQAKLIDELADIQLSYENAIDKDELNARAYLQLAKFYLYRANSITEQGSELDKAEIINFKALAINNLNKALKINPRDADTQLILAKIYLDKLPNSQLALSKIPDTEIDKAIKYLRNSILLNPYSLEANYQMADLEYKIGNIDLAYKYSQRLMKFCETGSRCVDELGPEKLEKAHKLALKVEKLAKGNPVQKNK